MNDKIFAIRGQKKQNVVKFEKNLDSYWERANLKKEKGEVCAGDIATGAR